MSKFIQSITLTSLLFLPIGVFAQAQAPSMSRQSGADTEYQLGTVLWTQSSAEYRALAYQAFSLARLRFDQAVATPKSGRAPGRSLKPPAIVVDVDETVMDNSRFQAELILRGVGYSSDIWQGWIDRAEAGAVPGAVEFLNYATRRGARVFYITNRKQAEKAGTMANLKKLGFPGVDENTVMVKEGSSSSKESRRNTVRERYRIVMLIGDNLNDFADDFSGKSIAERSAEVDRQQAQFGSMFIVVPNPMYGDWEAAVYGNKSGLKDDEKRAMRRAALRGITIQP
jgi:5'-nucleotidase (lipoprotein e(P4) family)